MKVFVTGATGYIGGSVAEKLVASDHEVRGLVRPTEKEKEKIPLLKARGINPVVGTLDDPEILTSAAQAADAVIHAASADHPGSVVTLVTALERNGKLLINTTGSAIVADHADGAYAAEAPLTEDTYFEPVPYRRPRVDMNRYVRQAAIEKGIRSVVNGTLNLPRACRYRHFKSDPSASSLFPRSREQCGQMLSSLSFALLGRAMMPARRLSLSR